MLIFHNKAGVQKKSFKRVTKTSLSMMYTIYNISSKNKNLYHELYYILNAEYRISR